MALHTDDISILKIQLKIEIEFKKIQIIFNVTKTNKHWHCELSNIFPATKKKIIKNIPQIIKEKKKTCGLMKKNFLGKRNSSIQVIRQH